MGISPNKSAKPVIPLDYGRGSPTGDAGRRVAGGIHERVDGVAQFFGIVAAAIGRPLLRRFSLSFGMGFAAMGFGLLFDRGFGSGPVLLGLGAFLIGLAIPLPGQKQ